MQIPGLQPGLLEVFRQVLGRSPSQRCHQNSLLPGDSLATKGDRFIHLPRQGTDTDGWIQQSRRSDNLLHHLTFGFGEFKGCRCGRYIDHLLEHFLKLFRFERPVIKR